MLNSYGYVYVEDDCLSREIMTMIICNFMGELLTLFEDSTHFMERLQQLPSVPKMILLDIHLKPYSGFDLLEMIRDNPNYDTVPVVALTASVMSEEVEKLRNWGFDGGIGKPLSVQTFPALLNRILNGEAVWHITDL